MVTGSRLNSRSSRGENCCEASCRATMVSVNVRLVTVITDAAIVCRTATAESVPPGHASSLQGDRGRSGSSPVADTSPPSAATVGHTHSGARRRSARRARTRSSQDTVRAYPRSGAGTQPAALRSR